MFVNSNFQIIWTNIHVAASSLQAAMYNHAR